MNWIVLVVVFTSFGDGKGVTAEKIEVQSRTHCMNAAQLITNHIRQTSGISGFAACLQTKDV